MDGKRSRKEIRLPDFDYSSPGWYFVTICTKDSKSLFYPSISKKYGHDAATGAQRGRPYDNVKVFVGAGSYPAREIGLKKENTRIVENALVDLETKFYTNLSFDFYAVMPNHVHLIVVLEDRVYRKEEMGVPTRLAARLGARPYTLGNVINSLKGLVSRNIGESIWQRGFYEHIIRSESSLDRIRNYILHNPDAGDFDWRRLDPKPV